MSIFTSPPSDTLVALLWGDCWWTSESAEPILLRETSEATSTLLDSLDHQSASKRIRLIYQPDHLVSEAIECPNGNRSTLQSALQSDYPALADPKLAWSFEPINEGSNTTLLHYETQPGLLTLIDELTASGFEVEGVWPLASVLNFVPVDWPETGALTVLAIAYQRTLVYRHTPAGIRQVNTSREDAAAKLAASSIQQAHNSDTTAFYFICLDTSGEVLEPQIAHWNPSERTTLKWPRLVEVTRSLPLTHSNQLIPPPARFTTFRVVNGATAAALILVAILAVQIGFKLLNQNEITALQRAEIEALRPEVEELQAREAEFKQLEAKLARFESSPTSYGKFLKSVGKQLPTSLVLTRLQIDATGFTLTGGVTDTNAVASDWSRWTDQLTFDSAPWRLSANIIEVPSTDFLVRGNWR